MELPYFTGMATGASLIIAIGAQNAFVLTQGIKNQHRFVVALICSLSDAVLITLGVAGMGTLIKQSPQMLSLAAGGGAFFLFIYGLKSLLAALKPGWSLQETEVVVTSGWQVMLTTLAITLLNPHVYLDTVVLLGGISSTYAGSSRFLFAGGAVTMSFLWFFLLSYGSGVLAPLFKKAITWRVLNGLIFIIMWRIAYSLLEYAGIVEAIQSLF
jgi:L-lysine exporter family protein LysE/ArgO